uniref:EGF-like domain-containing protein n=1 Tax=Anopheles maculatus TaxID=74869 RepID=A0A182SUA4_9DIPT
PTTTKKHERTIKTLPEQNGTVVCNDDRHYLENATPVQPDLTHTKGPDPECDKKCANKGVCNEDKICQCPEGYMGQYCQTALCYPQCMNGGNCTAPGTCSCPHGYQGRHCEGGICAEKCLNGGKCIQKDKCECTKGYYGLRCEYSKCVIPCLHDGKCRGVNKCRCKPGLSGDHCQIGRRQRSTCKRPCKHGVCQPNHTCACDSGWYGRLCNQRKYLGRTSTRGCR